MKSLLTGEKPPEPPELLAAYPRANKIAAHPIPGAPGQSQGTLL